MRKISKVATILITSIGLVIAGLVASPVATASENETVRVSVKFVPGPTLLTKTQKAAIKRAVTTSGIDATFVVTAAAGKTPGVSDRRVQLLAKKRGQVIKSYLVKLGVNKTNVTIKVKKTRLGIVPKTTIVGSSAAPVVAPAPAVAAPAALTCATGATCIVGDRGPGGGIVFYVSAANFTSTGSTCNTACKYLEVAPSTWRSAGASIARDLTYMWSDDETALTLQDITTASTEGIVANSANEKLNWKIGQGFNNTRIMKVTGATSAAQAAVLAYAGNATAGQWFIPSMNELNELCKFARGQTTGGLTVPCDTTGTLKTGLTNDLEGYVANNYWSSTEFPAADRAWFQRFIDGVQFYNPKSTTYYVRPIRAF